MESSATKAQLWNCFTMDYKERSRELVKLESDRRRQARKEGLRLPSDFPITFDIKVKNVKNHVYDFDDFLLVRGGDFGTRRAKLNHPDSFIDYFKEQATFLAERRKIE